MATKKSMKGGADSDYVQADRGFYCEPNWCVQALMEAEQFPGVIWDPCCGRGNIPNTAIGFDYVTSAIGTDIHPQDVFEEMHVSLRRESYDFLEMPTPAVMWPDHMIFNAPFHLNVEFIIKALGIARWKVAALLRENFLHSWERYHFFTRDHPPARIYFMSDRPSMPPGEAFLRGDVEMKGGSKDYFWAVWDKGVPAGRPSCHWLLNPNIPEEKRRGKKASRKIKRSPKAAEGAGAPSTPGDSGAKGGQQTLPEI